MSDGTILKADKDFTKEVDALIPEAQKLAQVGLTGTLALNHVRHH